MRSIGEQKTISLNYNYMYIIKTIHVFWVVNLYT